MVDSVSLFVRLAWFMIELPARNSLQPLSPADDGLCWTSFHELKIMLSTHSPGVSEIQLLESEWDLFAMKVYTDKEFALAGKCIQ